MTFGLLAYSLYYFAGAPCLDFETWDITTAYATTRNRSPSCCRKQAPLQ